MAILGQQNVLQAHIGGLGRKKRVPHQLALQFLPVLGMDQLVDALMHDVGLMEPQIALDAVRGEEHFALARQYHQEAVQRLQKHLAIQWGVIECC